MLRRPLHFSFSIFNGSFGGNVILFLSLNVLELLHDITIIVGVNLLCSWTLDIDLFVGIMTALDVISKRLLLLILHLLLLAHIFAFRFLLHARILIGFLISLFLVSLMKFLSLNQWSPNLII